MDAPTALRQGLINRIAPLEQLDAAIWQLADSICQKSPLAIAMGKELFYQQLEMGLEKAYACASEVMACNMMSEDAGEGIDAFVGKRQPVWQGR